MYTLQSIFIFSTLLTHSIFSTGALATPNFAGKVREVSAGAGHACALDDEGVKCWGDNTYGQTDVPSGLQNPRMISAGRYGTCAVHDEGVRCWGHIVHGSSASDFFSKMKYPLQISVGGSDIACALDAEFFNCTKWRYDFHRPPREEWRRYLSAMKNPRQVSAGDSHACVLTSKRTVHCTDLRDPHWQHIPVKLKNPREISAGQKQTCALDDVGVKCWGYGGIYDGHESSHLVEFAVPPNLKNPRQISAGGMTQFYHGPPNSHWEYRYRVCALDDEGVKCWIGRKKRLGFELLDTPSNLKRPSQISVKMFNACALDEEGVKCWSLLPGVKIGSANNKLSN